MNTEERQLAEMLHRVTPDPPRQVTVEDVAFRLASDAGQARGGRRELRARRGLGRPRGHGWAPVLAAASVMSEWVWFALGGDLNQVIRVGQGAGAGLDSVPTFTGGVVWTGGSRELACANPATGQVLASTAIPTDNGIVEYFGSVTVASSGRTYALYRNQAAQQSGVAALTPPEACSG